MLRKVLSPVVVLFLFISSINSQASSLESIWTKFSDKVGDDLIQIEQLNLSQCPESYYLAVNSDRTVLQWMDGQVFKWEEFDLDNESQCLVLSKPERQLLSIKQAQLILSRSNFISSKNKRTIGIIGDDDRVKVDNPEQRYPSIGYTCLNDKYVGATAFLITPYLALTNAHVVLNDKGEIDWDRFFIPGLKAKGGIEYGYADVCPRKSASIKTYGHQKVFKIELGDEKVIPFHVDEDEFGQAPYDYAAIIFDTPFNSINDYWKIEFDNTLTENQSLFTAGYPGDVQGIQDNKDMWETRGFAIETDYDWDDSIAGMAFFHTLDTTGGQSGSPILSIKNGTNNIIGLVSGGEDCSVSPISFICEILKGYSEINWGARLGPHNKEKIENWMNWSQTRPNVLLNNLNQTNETTSTVTAKFSRSDTSYNPISFEFDVYASSSVNGGLHSILSYSDDDLFKAKEYELTLNKNNVVKNYVVDYWRVREVNSAGAGQWSAFYPNTPSKDFANLKAEFYIDNENRGTVYLPNVDVSSLGLEGWNNAELWFRGSNKTGKYEIENYSANVLAKTDSEALLCLSEGKLKVPEIQFYNAPTKATTQHSALFTFEPGTYGFMTNLSLDIATAYDEKNLPFYQSCETPENCNDDGTCGDLIVTPTPTPEPSGNYNCLDYGTDINKCKCIINDDGASLGYGYNLSGVTNSYTLWNYMPTNNGSLIDGVYVPSMCKDEFDSECLIHPILEERENLPYPFYPDLSYISGENAFYIVQLKENKTYYFKNNSVINDYFSCDFNFNSGFYNASKHIPIK